MSSFNSISPDKLWRLAGVPHGPALIDVRSKDVCCLRSAPHPRGDPPSSRDRIVLGPGIHRAVDCGDLREWTWRKRRRGGLVARSGAASAEVLAGGQQAWAQAGFPLVPESKLPPRDRQGRTVWVTRARPKIDRIACPWLIRRFVDPLALFLFVAPAEVQAVAERFNGAPFDVEGVFWSHRGDLCTFDVMIDELGLTSPAALRAGDNR